MESDDLVIEEASEADAEEVVPIYRVAFPAAHPQLPAFIAEDHAHELGLILGAGDSLVARLQGRIVGFLCRVGDHVTDLFVHPAHQRAGIGGQLMRRAQAEVSSLHLEVFEQNTAARRFYASQGFTERDGHLDDHSDAWKLKLEWRAAAA